MNMRIPIRIATVFLMPLLVAACSGAASDLEATESMQTTDETSAADVSDGEDIDPPTLIGDPFSDSEVARLLADIVDNDLATSTGALQEIVERGDQRFVSVLLEMMRANQVGIVTGAGYFEHIAGLEALTEESFGQNWPGWVEWYGNTSLEPPPGFTTWKGELLGRIDSQFSLFLQDDHPSNIRVEEVQWGGVVVDGIPALDNAEMVPAEKGSYLEPGEPVFGVSINGDARAYPLRILDWHEMANDVVGEVPMSLAYCTLCGAGVAFDGRASDGNTYTFGSSGFLFRSNKLMYDRQTLTLWNQLTGEPVLGPLVGTGVELELLPVVLTTWEDWLEQHPDTQVLSLQTGYERIYFPGAAYGNYFASDATMFPVWQRSELLETKDRIYALRLNGTPKAYPITLLAEEQVVNDELAGTPVVLIAQRGEVLVEGQSLQTGRVNYDAGGEVRAYDRGNETFSPGSEPGIVVDSKGEEWQVTEEALLGPDGKVASRLNGHLAYWFGWFAFFPNTLLYGESR